MRKAANEASSVEGKINVIADEVIDILKKLSHDNEKQLSSKLIAEKIFKKESVKEILGNKESPEQREALAKSDLM